MTRGRLAPSPTGAQHLGNARTHLITYWALRSVGGELFLRIDDLDSPRVKDWAVQQAVDDIRWLGIDWDGPVTIQSQRLAVYQSAIERLTETPENFAYPCYCSRKDILDAQSAPHESRFRGEGPVYPGTCSGWRKGDPIDEAEHCWRLRSIDGRFEFNDHVLGMQSCTPSLELGDFPITNKAGQASYQLAVVVDDASDGVDLVVRGDDLVASTFRQLMIYQRFGYECPNYAHVPLVVGTDGRRLAKRHGDTRLSHYRDAGVSPESVVGWAAHSAGLIDRMEPCHASDLVNEFDWGKLVPGESAIDPETIFVG